MRSTRLRFLETTSFSVHIKTLSSKIVKHQIMPELGPREQSSRSKIIATISPRNQTCLTQTPFSLQRNLSEKNPLSPSSTILTKTNSRIYRNDEPGMEFDPRTPSLCGWDSNPRHPVHRHGIVRYLLRPWLPPKF